MGVITSDLHDANEPASRTDTIRPTLLRYSPPFFLAPSLPPYLI